MNAPLKRAAVALAAAWVGTTGMAATPFGDRVTLTGFGTLGVVKADTDQAQYRAELTQGRGASDDWDVGVDSKLGLQANATLTENVSIVGQMLVSRRLEHPAALEWLYGSARLPAGFELKLGRMVLPTFMVSDSRNVGYTAHWLRAPQEVYGTYPTNSFDGGQLSYKNTFGPVNLTVQASAGKARSVVNLKSVQPLEMDQIRSLNLLAETGDWLLRVGQTRAHTRFPQLPLLPREADQFTGFGLQYDNGRAIVMAEYVTRRQDVASLFDSNSWYLTGGWRFGDFTPYAIVSRFKPIGPVYLDRTTTRAEALGLRWNAHQNVALKLQLQSTQGDSASIVNSVPSFTADPPRVRVVSAALDFVF